jgi:NodT family efflux transporter outer membrane factor (OMF) lipoprotein
MMNYQKIAIACLLLSGCTVGPDFHRPAAPNVKRFTANPMSIEDQHMVAGADVPAQWWELLHSAPLNALVQRALAANPNIDAARAALVAAQESVAAQRGASWPQIAASYIPARQKIADSLSSPLSSPVNPFSLHTAQVSVSYTPDVFGGNRRQVESLGAQAEFQRFELAAARLSLAANVVTAAVQEAALRGQIESLEKVVAIEEEMLGLARRQLELGAIAEAGVVAQEATLAQTRAALPPLRKQLAQTRDLLTALAGTGNWSSASNSRVWSCPANCLSAFHRHWLNSVPMCVPLKRWPIPPAPRSALRMPTCCRSSGSTPAPAAWPCAWLTCSKPGAASGLWPVL